MSKIKLGKTGVEVIKEWVIKTFLKQQPKGVLTTLPEKDFVDLNTAITAEKLMRNGVDPNAIKNIDQVDNIINQLNKPRAVAADSPKGKGITEALFGKKGEVFNIQGEKLDPNKPIIGGTQQGKKINREFFERDAEAKEVQKRIESGVATTVEKMLAMEPIDAMKEANKVIKREGPYKNLSQKDARNILDSTEDHIFDRVIKADEFDVGVTDEVTKAYNDAVKKGKFKGTEEDFRNKIDNMMDEDFAIGGRVGLKDGNGIADEEAENARFAKRVRELMDEGFDMGEAVREAMKEGYADGGRIGLKKGMDRRTFMKIMGGLTTIPVFGKFFKGAEVASTVAPKVMENFSSKASEAPAYFFDLITKIKMFGKKSKVGPSERVDEYSYRGKNGDEYTLTEDITTGDAQITKDKMGIGTSGDKSFDVINDRSVMEYKAPKTDVDVETQRPINEGAEYEEYKIEFDQDGTQAGADAIDEMIQKEIIEEAAEEAPSIKKASGGIARMLGE